jgi:hypothetical protein
LIPRRYVPETIDNPLWWWCRKPLVSVRSDEIRYIRYINKPLFKWMNLWYIRNIIWKGGDRYNKQTGKSPIERRQELFQMTNIVSGLLQRIGKFLVECPFAVISLFGFNDPGFVIPVKYSLFCLIVPEKETLLDLYYFSFGGKGYLAFVPFYLLRYKRHCPLRK